MKRHHRSISAVAATGVLPPDISTVLAQLKCSWNKASIGVAVTVGVPITTSLVVLLLRPAALTCHDEETHTRYALDSTFYLGLTVALATAGFLSLRSLLRSKQPQSSSTTAAGLESKAGEQQRQQRKATFLDKHAAHYGYRRSKAGFIDEWRPRELPALIAPCSDDQPLKQTGHRSRDNSVSPVTTTTSPPLVYLDYAGAALPWKSQLQVMADEAAHTIYANPHAAGGPAANLTSTTIQRIERRLLQMLDALPGRYAGVSPSSSTTRLAHATAAEWHPGYDIVWTAGTTATLELVARYTAWEHGPNQASQIWYAAQSHTSVVGLRSAVAPHNARALSQAELVQVLQHGPNSLLKKEGLSEPETKGTSGTTIPNLLALPLECNFGGQRQDMINGAAPNSTTTWRQEAAAMNQPWYVLWDIAKAMATGPDVSLRQLNADFAVLSLYKIIGAPTGLGCLFVKRDIVDTWLGRTNSGTTNVLPRYYGGGAVDLVLPRANLTIPKSTPSLLRSLASGTSHFRGIVAVEHGLNVVQHELGGMTAIHRHVTTLARELVVRLRALRHANGQAVVQIYGGWAEYQHEDDHGDGDNEMTKDTDYSNEVKSTNTPGPTVAFNVRRQDGSFVGYNEVAKLAAMNRPAPIQLRVGCLCNPGACHDALRIDEDTVLEHYRKTGHVCGDDIDLVDGQPTGVVRASFGKDSLWEDLDALVTFIERVFVATTQETLSESDWDGAPRQGVVVEQYIFPIKSCAAQRVPEWMLQTATSRLSFDREFALVDASGIAMRLQRYPQMAFIEPTVSIQERTMTVRAPNMPDLKISLDPEESGAAAYGQGMVQVCGNKCSGVVWGDTTVSQWFSDFLQVECWLARFRDDDGSYELPPTDNAPAITVMSTRRDRKVAFANEQPLLLISKQAVDLLNTMLESQQERQVTSRHFRPNFVVSIQSPDAAEGNTASAAAHAEDRWQRVRYQDRNGLSFDVVGQCARCSMVDVDPRSGMKGHTLRALADYRRSNGQINFGIFLKGSVKRNGVRHIWVREGDTFACD